MGEKVYLKVGIAALLAIVAAGTAALVWMSLGRKSPTPQAWYEPEYIMVHPDTVNYPVLVTRRWWDPTDRIWLKFNPPDDWVGNGKRVARVRLAHDAPSMATKALPVSRPAPGHYPSEFLLRYREPEGFVLKLGGQRDLPIRVALDIWEGSSVVLTSEMQVPIAFADPAEGPVLPGITDPEVTRQLREGLRLSITRDAYSPGRAFALDAALLLPGVDKQTAIALQVEFVDGEETVCSSRFRFVYGVDQVEMEVHCARLVGDAARVVRAIGDQEPGWAVRVSSDPDLAISFLDAVAYWDDSLEIPLSRVLLDGP